MKNDNGINYKIATKGKTLCDTLYSKYPVRTYKDLENLLFNDLRIDENEFLKLDLDFIVSISEKYRSNTLLTLAKYINNKVKKIILGELYFKFIIKGEKVKCWMKR